MFAAVGYGSISVNQILLKLIDFYRKKTPMAFEVRPSGVTGRSTGGVLVNGQAGMLVRFAGCDELIGTYQNITITGATTWSLTGELQN